MKLVSTGTFHVRFLERSTVHAYSRKVAPARAKTRPKPRDSSQPLSKHTLENRTCRRCDERSDARLTKAVFSTSVSDFGTTISRDFPYRPPSLDYSLESQTYLVKIQKHVSTYSRTLRGRRDQTEVPPKSTCATRGNWFKLDFQRTFQRTLHLTCSRTAQRTLQRTLNNGLFNGHFLHRSRARSREPRDRVPSSRSSTHSLETLSTTHSDHIQPENPTWHTPPSLDTPPQLPPRGKSRRASNKDSYLGLVSRTSIWTVESSQDALEHTRVPWLSRGTLHRHKAQTPLSTHLSQSTNVCRKGSGRPRARGNR